MRPLPDQQILKRLSCLSFVDHCSRVVGSCFLILASRFLILASCFLTLALLIDSKQDRSGQHGGPETPFIANS
jgi:hypothetical protein